MRWATVIPFLNHYDASCGEYGARAVVEIVLCNKFVCVLKDKLA